MRNLQRIFCFLLPSLFGLLAPFVTAQDDVSCGDITISNQPQIEDVQTCETMEGLRVIWGEDSDLDLELPALKEVYGKIEILAATHVNSFSLPLLARTTGFHAYAISKTAKISTISLPSLESVETWIDIGGWARHLGSIGTVTISTQKSLSVSGGVRVSASEFASIGRINIDRIKRIGSSDSSIEEASLEIKSAASVGVVRLNERGDPMIIYGSISIKQEKEDMAYWRVSVDNVAKVTGNVELEKSHQNPGEFIINSNNVDPVANDNEVCIRGHGYNSQSKCICWEEFKGPQCKESSGVQFFAPDEESSSTAASTSASEDTFVVPTILDSGHGDDGNEENNPFGFFGNLGLAASIAILAGGVVFLGIIIICACIRSKRSRRQRHATSKSITLPEASHHPIISVSSPDDFDWDEDMNETPALKRVSDGRSAWSTVTNGSGPRVPPRPSLASSRGGSSTSVGIVEVGPNSPRAKNRFVVENKPTPSQGGQPTYGSNNLAPYGRPTHSGVRKGSYPARKAMARMSLASVDEASCEEDSFTDDGYNNQDELQVDLRSTREHYQNSKQQHELAESKRKSDDSNGKRASDATQKQRRVSNPQIKINNNNHLKPPSPPARRRSSTTSIDHLMPRSSSPRRRSSTGSALHSANGDGRFRLANFDVLEESKARSTLSPISPPPIHLDRHPSLRAKEGFRRDTFAAASMRQGNAESPYEVPVQSQVVASRHLGLTVRNESLTGESSDDPKQLAESEYVDRNSLV
eukprot:m.149137 g.149137  ORF g.149137 m.149137 type:complete len:754 (+) comp15007_c1_seq2:357-2618(+)